jgi:hypothetical protein
LPYRAIKPRRIVNHPATTLADKQTPVFSAHLKTRHQIVPPVFFDTAPPRYQCNAITRLWFHYQMRDQTAARRLGDATKD